MLASLRASVSQENQGLTLETRQLKEQLVAAAETSRAQDRTINQLLLDKIDLQSDSIGQRERMLERERHMSYVPIIILVYYAHRSHGSDLKASLGKEGLSDANREMLDQMQTEHQSQYQHIQELEARLEKVKTVSMNVQKGNRCLIFSVQFIRQQDSLARDKYGLKMHADVSRHRSCILILCALLTDAISQRKTSLS